MTSCPGPRVGVMRALTVLPLSKDSLAVTDMPDPTPGPGDLLVEGIALGVCGTDHEIADGAYGLSLIHI